VSALNPAGVTWIAIAIVSAVVEVVIPHFGLVFVSLAALAAALVATLGAGAIAQSGIFIIVTALCVFLMRPRLLSRLGSQGVPSRTEPLIGREGVVTIDIDVTVGSGRVNVGGEDWAARSASPLPAGTRVRVVSADGIILEVVRV
jgi:membrane protein implicated in regulation of membrane protease activity